MPKAFSVLEKNILKAKGLTDEQLTKLVAAGVASRADFATVGDAATLAELVPGLAPETATAVMTWAGGQAGGGGAAAAGPAVASVTIDTADVVYCIHCRAKQPKDYKSGDLCPSCGKQAEPVLSCYWCSASGPGKFCRNCGAQFLATADLDLGVVLKRDGVAKDEIPGRLATMSAAEKDALWSRVRKMRG